MPNAHAPDAGSASSRSAQAPRASQKRAPEPDPAGQSPEDPIEFEADTEVARGNEERANAEPEPAALHAAETPGVPDVAAERRHEAHEREAR